MHVEDEIEPAHYAQGPMTRRRDGGIALTIGRASCRTGGTQPWACAQQQSGLAGADLQAAEPF